jgi:hypothetical protein
MLLQEEKIAQVFNCVSAVRDYMRVQMHEQPSLVLSVDALKEAVENVFGVNIAMFEVTFTGEYVGGTIERYSDKTARILVKSRQSPEMMRFIATKELCHVMIDNAESWSIKGADTIRGLLREWELCQENGDGHKDPANPLQSEMLAEIGAMELIYPFEYRETDIAKLGSQQTTVTKIALDHEAPEWVIDQAISHHESFAACWSAITTKAA